MVFLVLETHRALHFGSGVDESAQQDHPAASDNIRRC